MNTRSLSLNLAAAGLAALTAGCAGPAQSAAPSDHAGSRSTPTLEQLSAGQANRTAAPTTPEPTASGRPAGTPMSAPFGTQESALLYYADGKIHDGRTIVAYDQEPSSTVPYLERTAAGWLLKEAWEHVGGQVVLVGADASIIGSFPVASTEPAAFDVADDGKQAAVLNAGRRRVLLIDTATGGRADSIATPMRFLYAVRYAGDDLVISGSGGGVRTMVWDADSEELSDLPYPQPGRIALATDVSIVGQAALVDSTVRRGARPCLTLFPVDPNATTRWAGCDVAAYEGALNVDGSRVITIKGVDASGYAYYRTDGLGFGPRSLEVTDTDSGGRLDSIDPPGLLMDATWTADGTILVKTAADRSATSYTLSECAVGGSCETVTADRDSLGLGRIG